MEEIKYNENEKYLKSLLKILLISVNGVYRKVKKESEFSLTDNKNHLLTPFEKSLLQQNNYVWKVLELISDLEKTHVFIRRFPNRKYYEENDLDQLAFIKYHYEVFLHKIHTLLEVYKLWLNDFYEIGLKHKDCSWNNLKNHPKVKESKAKMILEAYHETFKYAIKHRHLNTHQAYYYDNEMDKLKSVFDLYKGYRRFGLEMDDEFSRFYPEFILEINIKNYRKKRLIRIDEGIKAARYYSNWLIQIILTEYLEEVKR